MLERDEDKLCQVCGLRHDEDDTYEECFFATARDRDRLRTELREFDRLVTAAAFDIRDAMRQAQMAARKEVK